MAVSKAFNEAKILNNPFYSNIIRLCGEDVSILDLGCGDGQVLNGISRRRKGIMCGIDIDKDFLKVANKNKTRSNFILADAKKLPFRDNVFGCITMVDLFHHLVGERKKVRVLKESIRVSNNGLFFISDFFVKNRVFGFLLYWTTLFVNKLGISLPHLRTYEGGLILSYVSLKRFFELCKGLNLFLQTYDLKKPKDVKTRFLYRIIGLCVTRYRLCS